MTDLPESVNAQTLGRLLGLTGNRVSVLAADGILPKAGRGRYPLAEGIQAYLAWSVENRPGRPRGSGDHTDEKQRLTRAQADLAELKLEQARGELIDVEAVRQEWAAFTVDLRAQLLAVAPRVASTLGVDRAAAARLDAEIRAALEGLANGD